MNSKQIEDLLYSCSDTRRHFCGVYALDTLPAKPLKRRGLPSSYICNLDPISKPGSHWIAFFIPTRGPIEYFDSYGRDLHPAFFGFVGDRDYIYNTSFLQHPLTAVCGQYCIFYLWQRTLCSTMNDALIVFQPRNLLSNDLLVNFLVERSFDVTLNLFYTGDQQSSGILGLLTL